MNRSKLVTVDGLKGVGKSTLITRFESLYDNVVMHRGTRYERVLEVCDQWHIEPKDSLIRDVFVAATVDDELRMACAVAQRAGLITILDRWIVTELVYHPESWEMIRKILFEGYNQLMLNNTDIVFVHAVADNSVIRDRLMFRDGTCDMTDNCMQILKNSYERVFKMVSNRTGGRVLRLELNNELELEAAVHELATALGLEEQYG